MDKVLEAIKKYEEDPDIVVYYDSDNKPDYAINEDTDEMTVFQYGYFLHDKADSLTDIPYPDPNNDILNDLYSRIEVAISEYNKCRAHYMRCSSDNNTRELSYAEGKLNTLKDLYEEYSL